jgi:hypothetical protein
MNDTDVEPRPLLNEWQADSRSPRWAPAAARGWIELCSAGFAWIIAYGVGMRNLRKSRGKLGRQTLR